MTRNRQTWGTMESPRMCAPSAHHTLRTIVRMFRTLALLVTGGTVLATAVRAQEPRVERLQPLKQTGPELWYDEKGGGGYVGGRNSGPIVTTLQRDTVVVLKSIDPQTGSTIAVVRDRPEDRYRGQAHQSVVTSSDGEVAAIAYASGAVEYPLLGAVRAYDMRTGERLLGFDGTGVMVYAVSRKQDRILVWTEDSEQEGIGTLELRTLSTYTLIAQLPGIRADRATVDEFTGDMYVIDDTKMTMYMVRAADGSRGPSFGVPYKASVARLQGTDTLVVAGFDRMTNQIECALIDLRNRTAEAIFAPSSPDYSRFSSYRPDVQPSADGRTVYISNLIGWDPTALGTNPILSFRKDQGIQLLTEGIYTRGNLNGNDFGHTLFLPEQEVVLGRWTLPPYGLRAFALVPSGTSGAPDSEGQPGVTVSTDGRTVTCTDTAATILGIHDLEGRQMPAPCLDDPCRRIDVQALPSAPYVVRVALAGRTQSLTLSIVR